MKWTEEIEIRFSELRQKDLAGILSAAEKGELARLLAAIEADEKQYLAGAFRRIQDEQASIQKQIETVQQENTQLVRIIGQQELLIEDAQRWILKFAQ